MIIATENAESKMKNSRISTEIVLDLVLKPKRRLYIAKIPKRMPYL
tara:strand:- start:897 stop:1034 length:138 start_codon:yes stop_codon:yes gene_type:complete